VFLYVCVFLSVDCCLFSAVLRLKCWWKTS